MDKKNEIHQKDITIGQYNLEVIGFQLPMTKRAKQITNSVRK